MKTTLTIEQSQKLIELGVDPILASKCRVQHEADFEVEYRIVSHDEFCYEMASLDPQPIFDLSDLLSILPKEIDGYFLNISPNKFEWHVSYENMGINNIMFTKWGTSAPELIDALYQLLIYVLENNLNQQKK